MKMCGVPVRIFFEKYLYYVLLYTVRTTCTVRTPVHVQATSICSTTINIHVVQVVVPYRVPG